MLPHGVRIFDMAGSGGTSWSRIEHHRQAAPTRHDLGLLFQDWGLPTPQRPVGTARSAVRVTLIASGGVRNGLDMAKAMILGASLCGVAAPFLEPAMTSTRR
jgi:isopentenyl-diphosphate delta-isomerase